MKNKNTFLKIKKLLQFVALSFCCIFVFAEKDDTELLTKDSSADFFVLDNTTVIGLDNIYITKPKIDSNNVTRKKSKLTLKIKKNSVVKKKKEQLKKIYSLGLPNQIITTENNYYNLNKNLPLCVVANNGNHQNSFIISTINNTILKDIFFTPIKKSVNYTDPLIINNYLNFSFKLRPPPLLSLL